MRDILITEAITAAAVDELATRFCVSRRPELWRGPDKLKSAVGDCRALIVRNQTRGTAELLPAKKYHDDLMKAIGLPSETLEKVYGGTAERLLRL